MGACGVLAGCVLVGVAVLVSWFLDFLPKVASHGVDVVGDS